MIRKCGTDRRKFKKDRAISGRERWVLRLRGEESTACARRRVQAAVSGTERDAVSAAEAWLAEARRDQTMRGLLGHAQVQVTVVVDVI